jgi:hypothetical protein
VEVVEEVIGEDIIRGWLSKSRIRESLIIPDSPASPDAVEETKPPLPLMMKRRSAYTTQLEFNRMREEAGWSMPNPDPSPVVTGKARKPERKKRTTPNVTPTPDRYLRRTGRMHLEGGISHGH